MTRKQPLPDPMLSVGQDDAPRSDRFGDVYFDDENGLSESRHVFLGGCSLPQGWQKRDRFVIGETGFGTGLNFLATWQLWRKTAQSSATLHFLSVEGFPLNPMDLRQCLSIWPELGALAADLVSAYPDRQPGTHRLFFDRGRVVLTLLFGPVTDALQSLDANVDAWFLDGFAPDRNPEMWQPGIFAEIARLSRPGTRLATFSVAGRVRRDLQSAGFEVAKRSGTGTKREVLSGQYVGERPDPRREPWFAHPPVTNKNQPRVAVIGSGLSGAHVAQAFTRRGCSVAVIDRRGSVATEASSVPAAILMARMTAGDSLDGSFYGMAWRFGLSVLDELERTGHPIQRRRCGALQLATTHQKERQLREIWTQGLLPDSLMKFLNSQESSSVSGIPLDHAGLFFPDGGWLNPTSLCGALIADAETLFGQTITKIEYENGEWTLHGNSGGPNVSADIVVMANGLNARGFHETSWLEIIARLGQLTFAPVTERSVALACVIAGEGYVVPASQGFHAIGATFDHVADEDHDTPHPAPTDEADSHNLSLVDGLSQGLFSHSQPASDKSWTGLRCTTADHLPIAGPVPDHSAYVSDFADLRHGHKWSQYPPARYHPGLFVLTGLGARGLVAAPLVAELVASQACGDPMPLPRAISDALHPGRFTVRALK